MPIAKIQMPDGRIARIEVPEGTTQDQVMAFVSANMGNFGPAPFTEEEQARISEFVGPEATGTGRSRRAQILGRERRQQMAEAQELLRRRNPILAEEIEQMNPMEAALIGTGRGFSNVLRGLGIADIGGAEDEAFKALASRQPSAGAGEVVGEAAPFLIPGVGAEAAAARLGAKTLTRAAMMSGVGAAEGGIIARGRGGDTEDIILGTALGGLVGGGGEIASGAISRVANSLKAGKVATDKQIDAAIEESAPSIDTLKATSRHIFNELEQVNSNIKPETFSKFATNAKKKAAQGGLRDTPASRDLNPESATVLRFIDEIAEGPVNVFDLEDVRRAAQGSAAAASRAGRNQDAKIAGSIAESIDDTIANLKPSEMTGGGKEAASKFKLARDLWGRARRSELIQEALDDAENQASGFENGIRIAFRKLLRNKKKRQFFRADEIDAMKKVEQGSKSANIARFLGGFAFGSDKVRNILGGTAGAGLGAGAGAAVGGPIGSAIGAMILPTIGTVSRSFSERLTKGGAEFADRVIRAGRDGRKITKAYLENTPKELQDPEELAQLLMRPNVEIPDNVVQMPVVRDALRIVENLRGAAGVAPIAAVPAVAAQEEE